MKAPGWVVQGLGSLLSNPSMGSFPQTPPLLMLSRTKASDSGPWNVPQSLGFAKGFSAGALKSSATPTTCIRAFSLVAQCRVHIYWGENSLRNPCQPQAIGETSGLKLNLHHSHWTSPDRSQYRAACDGPQSQVVVTDKESTRVLFLPI